jgi:hypothetical protein
MGVTIHFEGQLKSDNDFNSVMTRAKNFAWTNEMPYEFFSVPLKKLGRVKDEKDWDYEGPAKGIKIQPDPNSDPLWLEFDKNNYIQEYCKTQFAGIGVHLKIISLLKEIEPYFNELFVIDEGEYWETNDAANLQSSLDSYFEAAEKAMAENPKLDGPFRLEDGRIVDLIENPC